MSFFTKPDVPNLPIQGTGQFPVDNTTKLIAPAASVLNRADLVMSKASQNKAYSERKDAKRFKQLNTLKKDMESIKYNVDNPDMVVSEVKNEMENALLRLADQLVIKENKIEQLEKECNAAKEESKMKDARIKMLEDRLQQMEYQLGGISASPSPSVAFSPSKVGGGQTFGHIKPSAVTVDV